MSYWVNDVWDEAAHTVPYLIENGLLIASVEHKANGPVPDAMYIGAQVRAEYETPAQQAAFVRDVFGDHIDAVDAWQLTYSDGDAGNPHLSLYFKVGGNDSLIVDVHVPYSEEVLTLLGIQTTLRKARVTVC